GTSMPPHPCPNLVAVAAAQPPNQVGAGKMTRTNLPTPTDASRWLTQCVSQSHVSVVSTVKTTNVYD
ncbi:MAG: hypothetical protein J6W04_04615, partial [Bacteroidales bacterium]|nr:hypothetical protein [Bacteroidales bacterium]